MHICTYYEIMNKVIYFIIKAKEIEAITIAHIQKKNRNRASESQLKWDSCLCSGFSQESL